MFGFGAGGTVTDGQLYGLDFKSGVQQEMAREALHIILDCWKPGGPDDFQGRFWSIRRPSGYNDRFHWHLSPFSDPTSRVAFAGFMPKSGSLTIAGERGYIPMSFNVAPEHVSVHWDSVCAGGAKTGRSPSRTNWRQIREIYVADTTAEARRAVLDGFMAEFWDRHFRIVAGGLGILDMFRRSGAPPNVEPDSRYLVDHGTWFVGDPERVASQIIEQYRLTGGFGVLLQIGFDYADAQTRAGWFRSMELLGREVLPRVRRELQRSA